MFEYIYCLREHTYNTTDYHANHIIRDVSNKRLDLTKSKTVLVSCFGCVESVSTEIPLETSVFLISYTVALFF